MNSFLSSAKQHLRNSGHLKNVHVILGNETCDMDSAVSSLVYSFLQLNLKPSNEAIIIPVFNIPRIQFPIKTEVTYVLKKYGINLDNIICRDEVDLECLQIKGCLKITLVDHHALHKDVQLKPSVVAVLDHRPPDPAWPWNDVECTLKLVGSCSTLVAEQLFSQAPHLITPEIAMMLLGTILLDTVCLSKTAGRAVPLDNEMTERLCLCCPSTFDKEQLYNELKIAKADISSLTSVQLLIKDFKMASSIPIAGLPIKVKELLQRDDANHAVCQFCEEQNVDVCVIYGQKENQGSLTRDIAVFAYRHLEAASQVVTALLSCKEPCLNLQLLTCLVPGFTLFEQINIKASRKQILPIVQQVAEDIKKSELNK